MWLIPGYKWIMKSLIFSTAYVLYLALNIFQDLNNIWLHIQGQILFIYQLGYQEYPVWPDIDNIWA